MTRVRPPADPSGRHESLWLATTERTDYGALDDDRHVDVAVVGGGIAGVTTASKLVEAGRSVALLERDRLLAAVTGHTTAKLTALHGLRYADVERDFDAETAAGYAEANRAAIEDVAATVEERNLDCGFRRTPAYTYVTDPDRWRRIRAEVDAATRAGLSATYEESLDVPADVAAAVSLPDQACFHPRQYLLALAREIPGGDSHVFERTTVTDVAAGEPCTVGTDRGEIRADDVVIATHFPIVDRGLFFARLAPKRSYVLAARLSSEPPGGVFYRASDPYFSIRPYAEGGEPTALFGGQNHRTGAGDETERYRALEETVRSRFDVTDVAYRWATQDYVSADGLPFVGRMPTGGGHLYVATGFGGWGMTNGTAAGILLCDLICGRDNDWVDVFDPGRVTPLASVGDAIPHNVRAVSHLARGRLAPRSGVESADPRPGEWDVYRADGDPVAVARDGDGELHAVSAICPHMGCVVRWNDAERSWDCPCHGSRFDADGTVLDTPAATDLSAYDLRLDRRGDADVSRPPPDASPDADR